MVTSHHKKEIWKVIEILFYSQHAEVKKQCEGEKRRKAEIEQKQSELSQELAMLQVCQDYPFFLVLKENQKYLILQKTHEFFSGYFTDTKKLHLQFTCVSFLKCEKSKMEASLQQSTSDTEAKMREAEQSQSQIMQDKQVGKDYVWKYSLFWI